MRSSYKLGRTRTYLALTFFALIVAFAFIISFLIYIKNWTIFLWEILNGEEDHRPLPKLGEIFNIFGDV